MAHFAEIDENNVVLRVAVVNNEELMEDGVESESKGVRFLASLFGHSRWKQTSYNAGGLPEKRYRYAAIGYSYDPERDAFISPQPFPSWTLSETTCQWTPPSPRPEGDGPFAWDEGTLSWVTVVLPE